jgi:predicted nucleotidyltransferase
VGGQNFRLPNQYQAILYQRRMRTAVRELSDVYLIAEFDAGREHSLLGRVSPENRLADVLGVKVDLTPARTLKDGIRERAAREAVLAF